MLSVDDIAKAAADHRFLREVANAIQKCGACEIRIEKGGLTVFELSKKRRYDGAKIENA